MSAAKIQSALQAASQVGCVTVSGCSEVTFTHDRMHAAAITLIQPDEALDLHLSIGKQLHTAGPAYIFTAVDALLSARKLGDRSTDVEELCNLLIAAIKRASRSAAFELAYQYLRTARALLCETYGEADLYSTRSTRNISFQLIPLWAEVCGALGKLDEAIEKVRQRALETGWTVGTTADPPIHFLVTGI
jgi:predicted ATPase